MRWIVLAACFGSGCLSAEDLATDTDADTSSVYYQQCLAIVTRFQECGTPMSCSFTTETIADCEAELTDAPDTDVNAIVYSPCDLINNAICSDATYAAYCSC